MQSPSKQGFLILRNWRDRLVLSYYHCSALSCCVSNCFQLFSNQQMNRQTSLYQEIGWRDLPFCVCLLSPENENLQDLDYIHTITFSNFVWNWTIMFLHVKMYFVSETRSLNNSQPPFWNCICCTAGLGVFIWSLMPEICFHIFVFINLTYVKVVWYSLNISCGKTVCWLLYQLY